VGEERVLFSAKVAAGSASTVSLEVQKLERCR
jgi:hypothetical protein